MKTQKIYEKNVYQRELTARVLSRQNNVFLLDQTIFFPGGGGQSCDKGWIQGFPVLEVFEKEGQIYHRCGNEKDQEEKKPSSADEVFCKLDWAHRFENMQRHCGEHILSGIFYEELGGVNRGFHMGQDYMTIDISLEDPQRCQKLTQKLLSRIEQRTNQAIWANSPVTTIRVKRKEDAKGISMRKALTLEEDIAIVCTGTDPRGTQCAPCCGTHPQCTAEVGLLKIYRMEKNKDLYRIYFEAGNRALEDYQKKHRIFATIAPDYSATRENLLSRYQQEQQQRKEEKDQLHRLKRTLSTMEARRILDQDPPQSIHTYDHRSSEDLAYMGKQIMKTRQEPLILVCTEEKTVLLFSQGKPSCAHIIQKVKEQIPLRGGGSPQIGRLTFSEKKQLDDFIIRGPQWLEEKD